MITGALKRLVIAGGIVGMDVLGEGVGGKGRLEEEVGGGEVMSQ